VTEGALSFHAVKHHLSYRFMGYTSKLNQVTYFDSDMSENVTCERIKTGGIINNLLAPLSVVLEIQDLNEISCTGVSTDGSNHDSLKAFPTMIQYSNKVHGIKSKLAPE
jgi:hypothetical protein